MKPILQAAIVALLFSLHFASAALEVVDSPGTNVSPDATVSIVIQPSPPNPVAQARADLSANSFFGLFSGAKVFFRESETAAGSDPGAASITSMAIFNEGGSNNIRGGQAGTDNWAYITSDVGLANAWVQVELNGNTFTPLRYIHDPANPTDHIPLADAIALVTSAPRDIQIRSVDFTTNVMELKNFGPETIDLDGWRFCSHDVNQVRRYSSSTGLNGRSIPSGASLFIHFDNDSPGGTDHIDASSVGSFAGPLTNGAYGIQLYFTPISFGNGNTIADHLQWNHGGIDDISADDRSDEAQAGGVWTHQSSWIVTSAATDQIILTDTNNGVLHGPNDYLPLPDFQITNFEHSLPSGDVIITFPDVNNLSVNVQKANDISANDWTTLFSTSSNQAFINDETDPSGYYRIEPLTP